MSLIKGVIIYASIYLFYFVATILSRPLNVRKYGSVAVFAIIVFFVIYVVVDSKQNFQQSKGSNEFNRLLERIKIIESRQKKYSERLSNNITRVSGLLDEKSIPNNTGKWICSCGNENEDYCVRCTNCLKEKP